jgi:hypothetical protein
MEDRTTAILKRIPTDRPIIGAEIGVFRADNAVALLEVRPHLTLFCIDQWLPYPEQSKYDDPCAREGNWGEIRNRAIRQLMPFLSRAVIMGMSSTVAAKLIPDELLDFAWIDAFHQFPYIDQDIRNYRPKVRSGGWLGGHDYRPNQFPDVVRAVDRLAGVEFDLDSTWFWRVP